MDMESENYSIFWFWEGKDFFIFENSELKPITVKTWGRGT